MFPPHLFSNISSLWNFILQIDLTKVLSSWKTKQASTSGKHLIIRDHYLFHLYNISICFNSCFKCLGRCYKRRVKINEGNGNVLSHLWNITVEGSTSFNLRYCHKGTNLGSCWCTGISSCCQQNYCRILSLGYKTRNLERIKYSGKWARRFTCKFSRRFEWEEKEKLGHAASREITWRTEGPKKDRDCSFYHSLDGNGIVVFSESPQT